MKNGKYIIKIKIDGPKNKYENYQIIYVNDKGEISEFIDGTLEGDYIVFETTHLSQYGVIANPVVEEATLGIETPDITKSKVNVGNIFKVSILLAIVMATITLISFILLKSDLLTKKKKKRKRA